MKTIDVNDNRPVFQGDIMICRVKRVPTKCEKSKDNIVAHSETGHHHVAEGAAVYVPGVTDSAPDGMTLYAKAAGGHIDFVHLRDYDTHETLRFLTNPGDVLQIRRQREYTPRGWRRVED